MFAQLVADSLIAGSIYALIGVGFSVIFRAVRFFHLAHGLVYTAGAYIAYTLINEVGFPFSLSLIISSLCCAPLGIAMEKLIYAPLRKRQSPGLVYLIASLGILMFGQNAIALVYGSQILRLVDLPVVEGHLIAGARVTTAQLVTLLFALGCMSMLWLWLRFARLGTELRAVADDRIGASVVGINPNKITALAFGVGSALAGMAGILVSLQTNLHPTMGFIAVFKGVVAVVIGGMESVTGAVVGGLLLGLAENVGIWKIQAGFRDGIAFGILIIFLAAKSLFKLRRRMTQV